MSSLCVLSLPKGYFKIGVYRWEYIVTLLLRMGVSWLGRADVGNVFCFSFPIFYREEGSFYNGLDLEYFVSPFMYYLCCSIPNFPKTSKWFRRT